MWVSRKCMSVYGLRQVRAVHRNGQRMKPSVLRSIHVRKGCVPCVSREYLSRALGLLFPHMSKARCGFSVFFVENFFGLLLD